MNHYGLLVCGKGAQPSSVAFETVEECGSCAAACRATHRIESELATAQTIARPVNAHVQCCNEAATIPIQEAEEGL